MNEDIPFTSFEARLASLRPRGPKLDRDHLMFLAGQASVTYWPKDRRSVFWPISLTAAIAVAVTTLFLTVTESASRIVDRVASASTQVSKSERHPLGSSASPTPEELEYRIEVGNPLGLFFSFLVGKKPVEVDTDKSSQSLVHLRASLLKEGTPTPVEPRTQPDRPPEPNNTREPNNTSAKQLSNAESPPPETEPRP